MAIDPGVITLGFGNGTFDPGVAYLPTLGYSIGAAAGIGCVALGKVVTPVPYLKVVDAVPLGKMADPVPLGKTECN